MKVSSVFLFLFLALTGYMRLSAQFIIAGEGDCTQFSINYSPPLMIYYEGRITNGAPRSFDINGDGVMDLTVGSEGYNGGNYSSRSCFIKPLGQNEIAWGKTDSIYSSCNGNPSVNTGSTLGLPKVFLPTDTINANQVWQNNTLYFEYYERAFNCSSYIVGLSSLGPKIIGIRIITATDTLYGWIHFSPISYSFMSISGFACEANRPCQISINPNPVVGDVIVKLKHSTLDTEWQLYDQMGQMVMNGVFENITNYIETNHLAAGMYFLKTKYSTTKLVKVIP
ncbi:MAG: T9SS type A sorting domain-containing protein [Bacteroidota bacterium]